MNAKIPAVGTLALCLLSCAMEARADDGQPQPMEIFEQRIMPIFRSPEPSSCVQCHLSSVDLKDYIQPSCEATFQALREDGLINVEHPENSKILTLIAMGEQDLDKGASLIHAKTRKAEYDAFAAWIAACCKDTELLQAAEVESTGSVGPSSPNAVIRHNRKDRLIDSFTRNIWSQRMRCFPCHTPHEIDAADPKHEDPRKRHAELVAEYGQKMNLFRATPDETLRVWVMNSRRTRGDNLPLINAQQPKHSLIVLKPTAKLPVKSPDGTFASPSSALPVSHMGGLKMHVNDQSYKSFMTWIADYARVTNGEYAAEDELPPDNWYPTEHVLRIKDTPQAWPSMSTVQLFVFAWDNETSAWSSEPVAFTQAIVAPRRMVNGSLFLLANSEQKKTWSPQGEQLGAGRYLIRACVDRDGRLEDNPTLLLDYSARVPQAEIDAAWNEGFQNAEIVDGHLFGEG